MNDQPTCTVCGTTDGVHTYTDGPLCGPCSVQVAVRKALGHAHPKQGRNPYRDD